MTTGKTVALTVLTSVSKVMSLLFNVMPRFVIGGGNDNLLQCFCLENPMDCSTNSWSLLKLMSIKSVMPSNHLILCCPLLLLPSIFPSIRVFSNESILCIRWPKYWSFSYSISPSNEYTGLISFRIDWLDLFQSKDSQKSSPTPQFKSFNSSALSFLYSPTLTSIHDYWKNHSLD